MHAELEGIRLRKDAQDPYEFGRVFAALCVWVPLNQKDCKRDEKTRWHHPRRVPQKVRVEKAALHWEQDEEAGDGGAQQPRDRAMQRAVLIVDSRNDRGHHRPQHKGTHCSFLIDNRKQDKVDQMHQGNAQALVVRCCIARATHDPVSVEWIHTVY